MKLLVDTHTLLWSVDQPSKLSSTAFAALTNPANERYLSAATIIEVAIKVGLGKLTLSSPNRQWMAKEIVNLQLTVLPITVDYADFQVSLPHHHRDPFDRLMIAQAMVDQLAIVSSDAQLDAYGVTRVW